MKRVIILLLLFFCFSASTLAYSIPDIIEENGILRADKGWVLEQEGIRVAYFSGSPLEIGMQQGLLGAEDAMELWEMWQSLQPSYQAQGFDRIMWFFKDLYARFQFFPAFKRYTPDEYLEEMQGFILGASQGEESNFYDIMMGNASQDLELAGPACSAFAAWGEATIDGELYMGRNLDHMGMLPMARFQYLAFYNPEQGYPFVVHNYPSFIGTMSGMNAKGIVITSNYSIPVSSEVTVYGLPYMLLLRQALQYGGSIEEVIDIIDQAPRTIGLNLMVADAERAVVIELTANRMRVREGDHSIYTTNQFQHPQMKEFQGELWLASSLRDQRFAELIEQHWGQIDVPLSRDFMRDRYEDSPAYGGFVTGINTESTMASMVFVPGSREIWLARVGDFDGYVAYAADNAMIGFDAQAIWDTGSPAPILGVLEPTVQEGYVEDWFLFADANYLRYQGEYEKALEITEDILQRHTEAEIPLYLAGRLHIYLNNFQEALQYLERYLQLPSHTEPFYLYLGKVWAGLILDTWGERDRAIEYYTLALDVEVKDMPGDRTGFRQVAATGIEHPLYVDSQGQINRQ